ncbi:AraC family transcriptional regulator [Fusibacter sp. 3D3]|uniref:AraC family transcriptional regulator n=1 Tax=Fusibacter sp. 3D3 TaxID=1048380 RepID=UPI000852B4CC|nr:AraC family transcriptional regulator [Fusibacter sp. 3D3]GAU80027.1 transcriptional regulator [Fusibacter sp. 3D3]
MDWIKGIQNAINYIEANILDTLDAKEISKRAYVSNFHFQRTFNLLTGITVGEYIRNRRLTLAGIELTMSDMKIIDIAFKYGYDTPESFSRAFTRFHGVTPTAAKKSGSKLKSYSPLSIHVTLKGGDTLNYRIEEKEAFNVIAKVKRFLIDDPINEVEIPHFWMACYRDHTIKELQMLSYKHSYGHSSKHGPNKKPSPMVGDGLFGICDSSPKDQTYFNYAIGVESRMNNVPDSCQKIHMPSATWAVFTCTGPMPKSIQHMWKRIYSEFLPQSDYEQIQGIDFEYYTIGDNSKLDYTSEIWLPVTKKVSTF